MKVIRPGRMPEDEDLTGECRRCGCVIELKRGELKPLPDYTPQEDLSYYYDCPTCGEMIQSFKKKANSSGELWKD